MLDLLMQMAKLLLLLVPVLALSRADANAQLASDLDINPAMAYPTGFVLADDLPSLFRSFGPGNRHEAILNPARLSGASGFIVSEYLPSGPAGQQVAFNMLTGRDNGWLFSVIGSRKTTEQTTDSRDFSNGGEETIDSKDLRSFTNGTARIVRLIPTVFRDTWHASVGLRLGLQRDDEDQTSLSLSKRYSAIPIVNIVRYRMQGGMTELTDASDQSTLRAGIEFGLFDGRTDIQFVLQTDYSSVDEIDNSSVARTDVDSTGTPTDPLNNVDRTFSLIESESEWHSTRPGFSAGIAVRSLVANRGNAHHFAVFQAGASLVPGTLERIVFARNEQTIESIRNGAVVASSASADSARVESEADPMTRTIFAQAGYVHEQNVGRVTLATGLGVATRFDLDRSGIYRDIDGASVKRRETGTNIDWLVPAFVTYGLSRSIDVFGGVVFDLAYETTTTRFRNGPPSHVYTDEETRDGNLSAEYRLGVIVDQAGFFGQVSFSRDLADYMAWEISLGLDL